jgi:hypothetical protein
MGWMRTASLTRSRACCEGMQGVLWVLQRLLEYDLGTDDVHHFVHA